MRTAYFVGGMGDTDLIQEAIALLHSEAQSDLLDPKPIVIPFTHAGVAKTQCYQNHKNVCYRPLSHILHDSEILSASSLGMQELAVLADFIKGHKIEQICLGVPSIANEIPFQIALHLGLPGIIVNEYLFKAPAHCFWRFVPRLAKQKFIFAVPLPAAKAEIQALSPKARVELIGHISLDRALQKPLLASKSVREQLQVAGPLDELVFISGTTQAPALDIEFVGILLKELATDNYRHAQIRFGLHPGVLNPDTYLGALLQACQSYDNAAAQFKIVLTANWQKKLNNLVPASAFILNSAVDGENAALAAARVAQAVPGALLNTAAMQGKPCYYQHARAAYEPYLPKNWFARTVTEFFTAATNVSHTRAELGLAMTAPAALSLLLQGYAQE